MDKKLKLYDTFTKESKSLNRNTFTKTKSISADPVDFWFSFHRSGTVRSLIVGHLTEEFIILSLYDGSTLVSTVEKEFSVTSFQVSTCSFINLDGFNFVFKTEILFSQIILKCSLER